MKVINQCYPKKSDCSETYILKGTQTRNLRMRRQARTENCERITSLTYGCRESPHSNTCYSYESSLEAQ